MRAIALLLVMVITPAFAEDFKPITLEQSDLVNLNTILSEQIPPKYGALIIKWLQEIQTRQAEKK
jgi:hypothetical protein